MKNHGNLGLSLLSDDDRTLDQSALLMLEALKENLEDEILSEHDPYELYVKRVRLNMLKNLEDYKQRVVQGHLAILKELKISEQSNDAGHSDF